ncbi:MAG: DUF11 domain-containing protein, partial [Desulfobacteraceae bacterium]|nr:DUF11 domain-containing protein [Desulfobacteraceae bacterium]
ENAGVATLNTPIAGLAAGADTMMDISFRIDSTFQGTTIDNYAEISSATNALSQADEDSTPDGDNTNDAGGQAGSAADDAVDGDGTGTAGDGVASTDEDDHDSEGVTVGQSFDLALTKVLNTGATPGPFVPGSVVTYTIEVTNQGTLDATGIQISDYIPEGMTLSNGFNIGSSCVPDSSLVTTTGGGVYPLPYDAVENPNGDIQPPACNGVPYQYMYTVVNDTFSFEGNLIALDSFQLIGIDGLPEGLDYSCNNANCMSYFGNYSCLSISGIPQDDAGDYHLTINVKAYIGTTQFDLEFPGSVFDGEYILTLNDNCATWTENAGVATLNTPIAGLAAGADTMMDISFRIDSTFQGTTIDNYAEISS